MNVSAFLEHVLAGKWIAGYYPQDAVNRTLTFNSRGLSTMVNYLGEELHDKTKINEAVNVYIELVRTIWKRKLRAAISVKPTQIGLRLNYKLMVHNYKKIVKYAASNGVFVWLDMETLDCVDPTIKAYNSITKHRNTGICIQAYLKRSAKDADALIHRGAVIRLVKGAYKADERVAYETRGETDINYMRIMRMLFSKSTRFMIATHDSRILNEARKLNHKYKKHLEIGMLNGIRNRYALHLSKSKENVSIYVPFGSDWLGYGLRRITEQRHLSLILRSSLEKQEI